MTTHASPVTLSIDDVYGEQPVDDATLEATLDASLGPRPPTLLYDVVARAGLGPAHVALDVGCRDARHACELARRFGCRVLGVEPVAAAVARARAAVAASDVAARVEVREGRVEALPVDDASVDLVWSRDMLNHVPDLGAALRECARALRPGGAMVVFQTFATALLEPGEAARLYPPLAVVPANMDPACFERSALAAGFSIEQRDVVASEWREHDEERGNRRTARQLLRIARMLRDRDRLVATLGRALYECELADCHWGVYQMLGKLCPRVYLLRRA